MMRRDGRVAPGTPDGRGRAAATERRLRRRRRGDGERRLSDGEDRAEERATHRQSADPSAGKWPAGNGGCVRAGVPPPTGTSSVNGGPRDDRATAPGTVPGTAPAAVTRRHDQAASASYPPRVSPAQRREGGGRWAVEGGMWAVEDGRWEEGGERWGVAGGWWTVAGRRCI